MHQAKPKLIVFGGTFDPPHRGHRGCVELARQRFPSAEIWVLPAYQAAAADGLTKNPLASFEERYRMCELLFQAQRVKISRLEESLPSPNLTVQTLRILQGQLHYPASELFFLLGEDQWQSFPRWAFPQEILKLCSLLIVKRQHKAGEQGSLQTQIAEGCSRLGLSLDWCEKDGAWLEATQSWIYFIDQVPSLAASTLMRRYLHEDEDLPEEWLTEELRNYIDQFGLYQNKLKGRDL